MQIHIILPSLHLHTYTHIFNSLRIINFPDLNDLGEKLVVCTLVSYFIQIYIMPVFIILLFMGLSVGVPSLFCYLKSRTLLNLDVSDLYPKAAKL